MKKLIALGAVATATLSLLSFTDRAQANDRDSSPACTSGAGKEPDKVLAAGLTSDGRLLCFRIDKPSKPKDVGAISGLVGDTALVGIDYRVQNGLLYGVGNNGGLYTIDPLTAVATPLANGLTVALSGTKFGVDFNPAANALRIVSNTGQNLRITALDTAPVTNVDATLTSPPAAGTTLDVLGAAYTNSDLVATTATTLFDLNAGTNAIQIQSPANSGTLVNTGTLPVDVTDGDLDVYTRADGENLGYAVLVTPSGTVVTAIDLLNGQLTKTKAAPAGLVDIAIPVDQ